MSECDKMQIIIMVKILDPTWRRPRGFRQCRVPSWLNYLRTKTNCCLFIFQKFEEALKLKKEAKKKQKGSGGGTDESNSGTPQVSTYLQQKPFNYFRCYLGRNDDTKNTFRN